MTSHELIGFMPAALSSEVLEFAFTNDKEVYKAVLAGVAQALKVRSQFLERKPRAERHPQMVNVLSRGSMELVAGNLLRAWLLKKHRPLLEDFLNAVGIPHKEGVVDNVPDSMDDAKVKQAVDLLASKYPHPVVAVYLHSFNQMNDPRWKNLDEILANDPRFQF